MSDKKIQWGILSTAKIGVVKVIPAMQKGELCEIAAISSRNINKAKEAANKLNIPKAYGSYEELLNDPEIDAVYNPLPNHLHVPLTIKGLEAGKHVLCEKPIAMNAEEAKYLVEETKKHPDLKVMEAFMYRFHPQWHKIKSLVKEGAIGEVKTIHSVFTYFNVDSQNIRNKADIGGGALMDIGCYCISFPRFVLEKEPVSVMGSMDFDPEMKIDRLTSGILDFSKGVTATFTCSTQSFPYQRAKIFGTKGIIEIENPVYKAMDEKVKIHLITSEKSEEITFDLVDQYTIQGNMFSKSIIENTEVPTPLSDAVNNMKVIDAIVKSSETNSRINC